MKSPDQNDQLRDGTLDADPVASIRAAAAPKPMNRSAEVVDLKAKRAAENAPRVLTVKQVLESAARRSRAEGKQEACTTGHYQLDEATGGIRPGKGWVFAAETSWGKSSWLVAVTDENLKLGKRVLIVTAEDDEDTYGSRLLARRTRVLAKRIRSGRLEEEDEAAIELAVKNAETMPVFLDARGKTAEWTAATVEKLIDEQNIDLVAYDYLQEFSAARPQENHRLTVKHIAGTLRKVVKLKRKASVLFSQVTIDEAVKREFPNRNMIRDCRDVANAAEVILIGYTPGKAVTDGDGTDAPIIVPAGAKAIFVDKVKDGPKGFAVLADWDDDTASFNRVDRPRAARDATYDQFDAEFDDGDRRHP